ncbi:MAG: hypothetical protein M3T49_02950 [Candidatus Eremiobacteraeota bacterium]|nr:hypothetical protein [Candidatus Eremiobacteraeota bacterium]
MKRNIAQRGVAIVAVLLSCVVLMALLAVMVDVGTAQLRRSTQRVRALQASAGADAGAALVRAFLARDGGDVGRMQADLSAAHGQLSEDIDAHTVVRVTIGVLPLLAAANNDHFDMALQSNPSVQETPVQVVSNATVISDGSAVAAATTTSLLRTFKTVKPYSETVGAVDASAPVGVDSPGDPAGQLGDQFTTDLRIRALSHPANGGLRDTSGFVDKHWSDGNTAGAGALP